MPALLFFFLGLDCLSTATFFTQISSMVWVSLLFLSTESSVLDRGEKKIRGRTRGEAKYNNKLAQKDESKISKEWMERDEWNRVSDVPWSLRSRSISLSATETTTTINSTREPTNLGSCIVHDLLKKTAQSLSSSLSLCFLHTHTQTHTQSQSLLTSYLVRENRACSLLSP